MQYVVLPTFTPTRRRYPHAKPAVRCEHAVETGRLTRDSAEHAPVFMRTSSILMA
jgi:hypothetical protein